MPPSPLKDTLFYPSPSAHCLLRPYRRQNRLVSGLPPPPPLWSDPHALSLFLWLRPSPLARCPSASTTTSGFARPSPPHPHRPTTTISSSFASQRRPFLCPPASPPSPASAPPSPASASPSPLPSASPPSLRPSPGFARLRPRALAFAPPILLHLHRHPPRQPHAPPCPRHSCSLSVPRASALHLRAPPPEFLFGSAVLRSLRLLTRLPSTSALGFSLTIHYLSLSLSIRSSVLRSLRPPRLRIPLLRRSDQPRLPLSLHCSLCLVTGSTTDDDS